MRKVGVYFGTLFAIIVFGIVGYAVYTVRSQVPTTGVIILHTVNVMFIVILVSSIALPLVGTLAFLRWFFKPEYYEIGQFGGYARWFRKFIPLPPLGAITPRAAGATSIGEVKLNIPRLGDLIRQGLLTSQDTDGVKMLVGFRQDESPRYEPLPGVTAIVGMQNVGKSITMLMLIMIALFQRAHIVIVDTHNTKARSLYKKVAALSGLVTFALTEAQALQETKNFSTELLNRKNGSNPYPYIIFYDEFCSLIRSQNQELREALPVAMEEGSQEGQGFNLHIVAAIHDLSNDGIGDARLRSFFNWIFCHRMEAGQSKFVEAFNSRRNKQIIASLPQGHVMVRDEVNQIEYLFIPFGDSKDVLTARDMLQGQIVESRQVREISSVHTTRHLQLVGPEYGENSPVVNEPIEPIDEREYSPSTEELENIHGENSLMVHISTEDMVTIARAYSELSTVKRTFGRTELCIKAFGNKKKYSLVKAWCNERRVLMEGAHV